MFNKGTQSLIETLMTTVMKGLNLDPEAVKAQIGQIGQSVAMFGAQLNRIEAKQDLILKHIGVDYEQPDEQRSITVRDVEPEFGFDAEGRN